ALQGFIGWLTDRPGRTGPPLSDRSIRNALTPLRLCLEAAAAAAGLDLRSLFTMRDFNRVERSIPLGYDRGTSHVSALRVPRSAVLVA
ncbi:MAG: hypothetical protein WBV85_06610, partial [Solirubrobacteraceae bacterium]